jgi:hypothetical protein
MAYSLPFFNNRDPLVEENKTPSFAFHRWWQNVVKTILEILTEQDTILKRIRRISSHTVPTTIMAALDTGTDCTITINAHTRVYADGTSLAVSGTVRTGLLSGTSYGIYYDDVTLADATPTYVFTTVISDAQANVADGRHFCGVINTPPAGSGQNRLGGGAYAVGSAIGGEL